MNPDAINLETATYDAVVRYIAEDPRPTEISDMTLMAAKRGMLRATMQAACWNYSLASRWLGLNRATLRAWLKECGLAKPCS